MRGRRESRRVRSAGTGQTSWGKNVVFGAQREGARVGERGHPPISSENVRKGLIWKELGFLVSSGEREKCSEAIDKKGVEWKGERKGAGEAKRSGK
jgi:hypothetical protein